MRNHILLRGIALIIFLFFVNCTNHNELKKSSKTEFTYYYEEPEVLMNKGGVKTISFLFFITELKRNQEVSREDVKSLIISIPENKIKFSLNDQNIWQCKYSYFLKKDGFKSEVVKHGRIEGEKIEEGIWKIKIKFKEFDFDGLVMQNKKHANHIIIETR
ncbi:hypothetical protein [Flavobacterium sp. LM4]|uniref:hypothetical protein n=1 Tax=Flavobacterium sp. LM4 TaxID=1938609 RepID=UPI00099489C9|nr:hypothetical protein [Flavobacterium sp. LM4]OOV17725.1 hypothetical protein BXU10_16855 [Flavobacterium sp. LM4]